MKATLHHQLDTARALWPWLARIHWWNFVRLLCCLPGVPGAWEYKALKRSLAATMGAMGTRVALPFLPLVRAILEASKRERD